MGVAVFMGYLILGVGLNDMIKLYL